MLSGARFLQLQICYRPERLEAFCRSLDDAGITARAAILPTICLVRGASALRFMDEKVPGISVPAGLIAAIAQTRPTRPRRPTSSPLEQARHALTQPGVRGLHLADFRHDGSVARLCADLGIPTRDERDSTHAHRPALSV